MSRSSADDGLIDNLVVKNPFIFEGFYGYPDVKGKERRVSFVIDAEEHNGSFEGFVTDAETENLFEKGSVRIKGFVRNGIISFVKTYPQGYQVDEQGEVRISESRRRHPVEYEGNWSEEEQKFAGIYSVSVNVRWIDRFLGKYTETTYEGPWEMRRSDRSAQRAV